MNKFLPLLLTLFIFSCSKNKVEKKGFSVSETRTENGEEVINGLRGDTLSFETKPRNVLLTNNPKHRLIPIYKVNYHKRTKKPFTGSNAFHTNYWEYGESDGNDWNQNFMPGFEAAYGYNFVNVSHHNNELKTSNNFFDQAVLIKTLYYPAFSKDTLNGRGISRGYYMISAYDEDTNKDGFINTKDLRRFYYFDINAQNKSSLVPKNYSVMSSEYDPDNDYMYIFARLDENKNGQMEYEESTHVFWIDLQNPKNRGIQYKGE